MIVLLDVGSFDYFVMYLEVCNYSNDMYKSLIRKSPLHFNSSLLHQSQFDDLTKQIWTNYLQEVDKKGVEA